MPKRLQLLLGRAKRAKCLFPPRWEKIVEFRWHVDSGRCDFINGNVGRAARRGSILFSANTLDQYIYMEYLKSDQCLLFIWLTPFLTHIC